MNVACFMLSLITTAHIWLSGAYSPLHTFVRFATRSHIKRSPSTPLYKSFAEAMILLDEVVKILALPQFASAWHHSLRFQFLERFWIGRIFINRNDARSTGMSRGKHFREEAFGCLRISERTEHKCSDVPTRID